VPGIHVFTAINKQDVDGRNKSGHDAVEAGFSNIVAHFLVLANVWRIFLPFNAELHTMVRRVPSIQEPVLVSLCGSVAARNVELS
jgi:hypothetical protein